MKIRDVVATDRDALGYLYADLLIERKFLWLFKFSHKITVYKGSEPRDYFWMHTGTGEFVNNQIQTYMEKHFATK